jgi:enoyl-CoA hydratase/carnithine racemase
VSPPARGYDGPVLITEDHDDVTVLRIERGRVGALDVELLDALTEAVSTSGRALVVTGSGSSFSAGLATRSPESYRPDGRRQRPTVSVTR